MAYKGYAVYRSLYLGHTESNAMVISSQVEGLTGIDLLALRRLHANWHLLGLS